MTKRHPFSKRSYALSERRNFFPYKANKSFPKFIALPAASVVESVWKVFRLKGEPPITRFDLAFVSMPRSYRIDEIKNKLGYKPVVNYQDGLEKMKQNIF